MYINASDVERRLCTRDSATLYGSLGFIMEKVWEISLPPLFLVQERAGLLTRDVVWTTLGLGDE